MRWPNSRLTAAPILFGALVLAGAQTPPKGLTTRWTKKVDPAHVLPEYPRPQMVRPTWTNLNGRWDFQVASAAKSAIGAFTEKILVPFPPESRLSGYGKQIPAGSVVRYRRTFNASRGDGRTLLHFGAVDWECSVRVNGKVVGSHRGGYDPFSFDITGALKPSGPQEVVVTAMDPTDGGVQPRGKQVRKPGGIFYTPTTGIWQTVWLEQVPQRFIERIWMNPTVSDRPVANQTLQTGTLAIRPVVKGNLDGLITRVEVRDGNTVVAATKAPTDRTLAIVVPEPKLWSPDRPHLYDLIIDIRDGKGGVVDRVKSYFAFRTVSVGPGPDGKTRILLNGKPTFMVGPLDQGFWPDGIYTAPTDEALKYDIEQTKRLGFNMIRKHVKVEPDRWYTWCDRMGILVWQDMPSGDRFIGPSDPDIKRTSESKAIFERELRAMIDTHRNHPSIVSWVLFNEGWGQYDTPRMAAWLKHYDPTRIVDSVTGWADRGVGDMHDWHVYPGPGSPKPEPTRAAVLGEFGGLGLVTPGHMWQEKAWGYQSYKTPEELTLAFESLFRNLRILIGDPGLSAAVYTQTTDVETEANGLMTYDRAVMKMNPDRVRRAVRSLFLPPPIITEILPTSEERVQRWRYTFDTPASGWEAPNFNEAGWLEGQGGFGTHGTPGASVHTVWDSSDVWIRRQFAVLETIPRGELCLRVHHDDAAEVYLDGKKIADLPGWTSNYTLVNLPTGLTIGRHVIAIHCHQDKGGQYIDAGLIRVRERQ